MKRPPPAPLYVTDHAVLRYLERVQGQPIDAVREHIRKLCEGPHALQATSVRAEGVRFELLDSRVVSVVPDGPIPSRISRTRAQQRIPR